MTLAELGNRIRQFRLLRHLTQMALARILHTTRRRIAMYEAGQCEFPVTQIPELCKALRISPNKLFGKTSMKVASANIYGPMFANSAAWHSVAARKLA